MLTIDDLRACHQPLPVYEVEKLLAHLGYEYTLQDVRTATWRYMPGHLTLQLCYDQAQMQNGRLYWPAGEMQELGIILARHARIIDKGSQDIGMG